jgi:hypothetical protein
MIAPSEATPMNMEVFLLFWDEMDDWMGACRHLLRGLT